MTEERADIVLPGLEWGDWEACGITVRTHYDASRQDRPGFIVADLSASPLDRRTEIARMIAAAPDLVRAAKAHVAAREALDNANVNSLSLHDPRFAVVQETLEALIVSIAKAEGRS